MRLLISLFAGLIMFFLTQGILHVFGISRSIPAVGAILAGFLAAFQYYFVADRLWADLRSVATEENNIDDDLIIDDDIFK